MIHKSVTYKIQRRQQSVDGGHSHFTIWNSWQKSTEALRSKRRIFEMLLKKKYILQKKMFFTHLQKKIRTLQRLSCQNSSPTISHIINRRSDLENGSPEIKNKYYLLLRASVESADFKPKCWQVQCELVHLWSSMKMQIRETSLSSLALMLMSS